MVGADALPDEDAETRQYGDEPACPGLQSKTNDADVWRSASDGGDEGLRGSSSPKW